MFAYAYYPLYMLFCIEAYYETAPEIQNSIQENFNDVSKASEMIVFEKIDISKFRKDIDIKTMYAEIFYAVDGYMLKNIVLIVLYQTKLRKKLSF